MTKQEIIRKFIDSNFEIYLSDIMTLEPKDRARSFEKLLDYQEKNPPPKKELTDKEVLEKLDKISEEMRENEEQEYRHERFGYWD